ncbi:class I lanthipeptide [Hymenobacter aquaticus]|uniref:class I lanthipeptide n=1 Tax=Hymenobacter aquaticus TaxID=1867101 RepID=UPI001436A614|nr:class I lanthipeptide [Hymenobacter aquaticus]
MKKKQITRKLSLNKQTLSLLDPKSMNAIKGGMVDISGTDPPQETQRTYTCC